MQTALVLTFRKSNFVSSRSYMSQQRKFSTSKLNPTRKAAAIVVGSEILTGKVLDTNSNYLAKFLFDRGIKLTRLETIHDDEEEIVDAIHRISPKVDYLFTSGGIGPTHDDITYESVARAFKLKCVYHEPTLEKLIKKGFQLNEARKRMAYIPEGSKTIEIANVWAPLVITQNVYILPGVPELFVRMLNGAEHLFQTGNRFHRILIYTRKKEGDIAESLTNAQKEYKDISIGSYPKDVLSNPYVVVSLESENESKVKELALRLTKDIEGSLSPLHDLNK